MKRKRFPKTQGEMQVRLESALEAFSYAWGTMLRDGIANDGEHPTWPPNKEQEQGTVAYYLSMGVRRAWEVEQGMRQQWGATEGQLCPWEDCAHILAFPEEGWYSCGHCGRAVYAEVCEGDFEDYHAYQPGGDRSVPEFPLPVARNLGPSWATPEEMAIGWDSKNC